jgi:hypothetical protein
MAVKVGSLYAEVFAKTAPFQKGMKSVDATLDATQAKFGGFQSSLSTIVTGAAFAAAGLLIKNAVDAAMLAEDAQTELMSALQQSGSFTESTKNELMDYAAKMQDLTAIDDQLIVAEMAHGLQLGIKTSQIKAATKAAIGLAHTNKISLPEAMKKVANASKGITTGLESLIVGFKKTGDKATDFQQVLKGTEDGFKAQEEYAKGTKGSIERLSLAYNDLIVKLGTVFLPVVNLVVLALDKLLKVMDMIDVPTMAAVVAFGAVLVIISKWGTIIRGLIGLWKALTTAIALAAAAAGDVTVWVRIGAALAAAAGVWYLFDQQMGMGTDHTKDAKKSIDGLANSLEDLSNKGKAFVGSANGLKPGSVDKATDELTVRALKLKELIDATHEAREAEMQRRRDLIGWKGAADLWKDTAVLGEQARFSAKGFGKTELGRGFNDSGGNQRIGNLYDIGMSMQGIIAVWEEFKLGEQREKGLLDVYKSFFNNQIKQSSNTRTWSDKPNDYTAGNDIANKLDKHEEIAAATKEAITDIRNMMRGQSASNLLAMQG